jgi:hypothetical protein
MTRLVGVVELTLKLVTALDTRHVRNRDLRKRAEAGIELRRWPYYTGPSDLAM